MRTRLAHLAALAVLAVLVAGCSILPRYQLTVANVDRDPVRILINGAVIADLRCTDLPLVLVPNRSTPKLPWTVEVRDEAGAVIGTATFDAKGVDRQWFLIRAGGLISVPPADPAAATTASVRSDCPGLQVDQLR
jgi:hypothetical protein